MYNANATYEENYAHGPDASFVKNGIFPKIKYTTKPSYSFLGIPLYIPFGVPAGPLLNSAYVKVALDAGFCLPTYKTVRSQAWESNKWPNVLNIQSTQKSLFATALHDVIGVPFNSENYKNKKISISNSFGVPSQTPEKWSRDFALLGEDAQSVCLSYQGTRTEKSSVKETKEAFYADISKTTELALECVEKNHSSLLEINLSCPNEVQSPLYKDLPSAVRAVKAAHSVLKNARSNTRLIAKIGVLSTEETKIFLSETAGMLNAVSAINTILAKVYTPEKKVALGSGALTGGVCGNLIFEQGLRMTELLVEQREKLGMKKQELGIIGVGGVSSAQEFQSYLSVGADLVQAATGMMWNLDLAAEIADSLKVSYRKE